MRKNGHSKKAFSPKVFFDYLAKGGAVYSLGGKAVPHSTLVGHLTTIVDIIAHGDNKEEVKEKIQDFLKDIALDKIFETFGSDATPLGIATTFQDYMENTVQGQM